MGSSTWSPPDGPSVRTALRFTRRSRPRPPAWSRTASPTSCAPPRSTTSSSGSGLRRSAEMRIERIEWAGDDAPTLAATIRQLQPALGEVSGPVTEIIAEVRAGGDGAIAKIEARVGAGRIAPDDLRQPDEALGSAAAGLDPDLLAALETAATNIRAVAEAQLADGGEVRLEQGQTVELREVPVGSAGIYAPGGEAAYPSTVLMGCIPAKAAGVGRVVLATPP